MWARLQTWPYQWRPYGAPSRRVGTMDPELHAHILGLMARSGNFDWAMNLKTDNQVKGKLGEVFMYHLLEDMVGREIHPYETKWRESKLLKRAAAAGFTQGEDNESIDLSFKYDDTWVHVCVKASGAKAVGEKFKSSNRFYEMTDYFLNLPGKTMLIRCRFNYVDIDDPMGPRVQLYLAVYRNY